MERVHTDQAPAAVGPYSQAVAHDGWLATAGQVGIDPATGTLVAGGVGAEARQTMRNLGAILAAAGLGFADVFRATLYLADMADFAEVNAVYAEAMGDHRPARSTVGGVALPLGARVEIDLLARQP